jgi:hypothetical protein
MGAVVVSVKIIPRRLLLHAVRQRMRDVVFLRPTLMGKE